MTWDDPDYVFSLRLDRRHNPECHNPGLLADYGLLRTSLSGTGVPRACENAPPLGPYRRPMHRVVEGSQGGGRFLMGERPLHTWPRYPQEFEAPRP